MRNRLDDVHKHLDNEMRQRFAERERHERSCLERKTDSAKAALDKAIGGYQERLAGLEETKKKVEQKKAAAARTYYQSIGKPIDDQMTEVPIGKFSPCEDSDVEDGELAEPSHAPAASKAVTTRKALAAEVENHSAKPPTPFDMGKNLRRMSSGDSNEATPTVAPKKALPESAPKVLPTGAPKQALPSASKALPKSASKEAPPTGAPKERCRRARRRRRCPSAPAGAAEGAPKQALQRPSGAPTDKAQGQMIIDTVISHMEKKLPKGMLVSRIKEKCGLKIKHYSRGWLVGMYKLMAIEPTTEASAEARRSIRRWPIEQIEELVASYRSDGAGAEAETEAAPISRRRRQRALENYRNDGAEAETEEEAEASDHREKKRKTAYMKWRPGAQGARHDGEHGGVQGGEDRVVAAAGRREAQIRADLRRGGRRNHASPQDQAYPR